MLEVSGIRLSLDAALPENAEMRKEGSGARSGRFRARYLQRCSDAQKRGCAQKEQRSFHHFVSRRIAASSGTTPA